MSSEDLIDARAPYIELVDWEEGSTLAGTFSLVYKPW